MKNFNSTHYDHESRIIRLEVTNESIDNTMKMIASELIDTRKAMFSELKEIREDMREIRKDMRSDFRWLISIIISSNTALLALMAHGFHWI